MNRRQRFARWMSRTFWAVLYHLIVPLGILAISAIVYFTVKAEHNTYVRWTESTGNPWNIGFGDWRSLRQRGNLPWAVPPPPQVEAGP